MANIKFKDALAATLERKSRGTGTSGDPFVTEDDVNILVGGTALSNANPVPVSDAGGSLTVDGTVALDTATLAALETISVANFPATQPVSAASLPLPTGAATEATIAAINTKIPASPATDRATAAAPASVRLSNGSAFITPTTPSDTQPVSLAPATVYRNINLGVTGVNAKTSAGTLYGYALFNSGSAVRYVKIYNTAIAPTASDTPVMTLLLPAGSGANVSIDRGLTFSAGIGLRASTGVTDADTGAPGTNEVIAQVWYV